MTVPRGTSTDGADERTQTLATPGAPAPAGAATAEGAGDARGDAPRGSSDSAPRHAAEPASSPAADADATGHGRSEPAAAVPRAGAHRAASPEERQAADPAGTGPGWSRSAVRKADDDSARTTVLPGAGTAPSGAARSAPPRPGVRSDQRSAGAARPLAGRTRRARLSLRRIDPWSVFLFSLVASVFLGLALVVAVAALYAVLGTLGVTESLNQLFAEVTGGSPTTGALLTSGRIIGGAAVLAAVNIVFLTLLATLSALLYNLCASFTGGIELTLGERD